EDWRPAPGKPTLKTLLFSSDAASFQCSAAMIVPSGNGSFPSRKAFIATSLPNCARNCFKLPPAKWATEIKRQSRYPAGIVMPSIGEALLSACGCPSLVLCAVDFVTERVQTAI